MPESRKIVKVFLASPGDLSDERKAAKSVVDEFNLQLADHFGYQVELSGWEDTVSMYGRPQATINRELERCELVVGLIWKRWGTPPDTTGRFTSGFEEEFETSMLRREAEGRPEISLFAKYVPQDLLNDPGDDLKKVIAFKAKLVASKKILYQSFEQLREFESKFRHCITNYITTLARLDLERSSVQTRSPASNTPRHESSVQEAPSPDMPLSLEGAEFVRNFVSKTEKISNDEELDSVEVARFRLLATIVHSPGNDDTTLGVHDANLLFVHATAIGFGQRENEGLLNCGLRRYSSESVPVWHWLERAGGFKRPVLPFQSIFDISGKNTVGALTLMRLISEPLPAQGMKQRNLFVGVWLAEEANFDVKVAALAYLGACGTPADLSQIQIEWERNDHQTASAAANAIVRINLRESVVTALASLFELQPASIEETLIEEIFAKDDAIDVSTLLKVAKHRHPLVRRAAVKSLRLKGALRTEFAEQLMRDDDDAQVRYEALKSLMDGGRMFTDEEVKNSLIKTIQNGGLGIISGAMSRSNGEDCLAAFQSDQLRKLDIVTLERRARMPILFQTEAYFIYVERNFKSLGNELRREIDDGFIQKQVDCVRQIESHSIGGFDEKTKVALLEGDWCQSYMNRGLEIIYNMKDPQDLDRVRAAFKSPGFVRPLAAFEYLRKFGQWSDIPLIINAISQKYSLRGASLLGSMEGGPARVAARAILSIGRSRLPEVLQMPSPTVLKCQIISSLSDSEFQGLSDNLVMKLLQSEHDAVRRITALKSVASLTRQRIDHLLKQYLAGPEQAYYNAIHWLDFGVSCPKRRATLAAKGLLEEEASKT